MRTFLLFFGTTLSMILSAHAEEPIFERISPGALSLRSKSKASNSKRRRGHQNVGSPRRLIDLVTQSPA